VGWFLRVKALSPNTFDSADIDHYAASIAAEGGLRASLAYFRDARNLRAKTMTLSLPDEGT
jgi:hypothetical protein